MAEPDPTIPTGISNSSGGRQPFTRRKLTRKSSPNCSPLTGLKQSQIIRAGYRALLREIERTPTLPAQQKITPTPRGRLEQIVEELKTPTHPLLG
jgi:hypothetical protein